MTEDQLQKQVAEWLSFALPPGCVFHHSPNEGTRHVAFKQKLKQMGTRFGWPDLEILVPADQARVGNSIAIFIELKRPKGGALTANQKDMRDAIELAGAQWGLARSIEQVEEILQPLVRLRVNQCHHKGCKDGWVYAPDGEGCVQSEHCPKCDGRGYL